jgi:hypothetical protein
MRHLKKDAPTDLIDYLDKIEETADASFKSLSLLGLNWNVSVWSLLVGGINLIESEIAVRGDNTFHLTATLLNVSRFLPIGIRWMHQWGRPISKLSNKRWSLELSMKVNEAISVANAYSAFLTCFPMWHINRYEAELISSTVVRFTAGESERKRQVSAYQKGIRPNEGPYKGQRAEKPPQSPRVQQLFQRVFDLCKSVDTCGFEYPDPWDLWRELELEYRARVDAIARRDGLLSLGIYNLNEFKKIYSTFLAICATHEFLCFTWGKNFSVYPFDSAVLVRAKSNWISTIAWLSGISIQKCQSIIQDLTFDFSRSLDLHIHPFVPLDSSGGTLAVAPQFPLHSRPDENILRVCSMLRPSEFDVTSLGKETEFLSGIKTAFPQYSPQGPVSLPKPNPDIDLIMSDEASSTIIIAELKWIRKTVRPLEISDRDSDVLKGIRQLKQIREFLLKYPTHLNALEVLPLPMDKYENVFYVLIARDHWLWIESSDDIAVVEFEPFTASLGRAENLRSAMIALLSYRWLPVEGRDFTVQYDRVTANGVSVESEVFYSL